MAENFDSDQYRPLFTLIYNSFRTLPSEKKEHYHYWYGDKNKIIKLFKGMSFPSIVDQEKMGKIKTDNLLVLCSSDEGQSMFYGAAIFQLTSKVSLKLISFTIHPKVRQNGFGTRLMEATWDMAKILGVQQIQVQYRTYWKSVNHWDKLLEKTGWSEPEVLLWYFTLPDINTQFQKEWFKNSALRPPFSVEEWNDSSFDQLKKTLESEDWQGKVPHTLNPFQMMEKILPHVSLLLKKEEEVVGWLICHLLQPDIVQGTSWYVHPSKAKGLGMALLAEVSKRRKLGAQVIFSVEKHNKIMLSLVRKHLLGEKTSQYELLSRTKLIL